MTTDPHGKKIFPVIEAAFNIVYLVFAVAAGILYTVKSVRGDNRPLFIYGCMTLLLAAGDAFHLVPRILVVLTGRRDGFRRALGFGKQVASITMTIFYLLLWLVHESVFGGHASVGIALAVLSTVRIVLCLFPQNRWAGPDSPVSWSIWRNLPFLAMGVVMCFLFGSTAALHAGFRFMPLAIAVSFVCYMPVAVLSKKYPAVGVLMLPKTVAYMWIVVMGTSLIA